LSPTVADVSAEIKALGMPVYNQTWIGTKKSVNAGRTKLILNNNSKHLGQGWPTLGPQRQRNIILNLFHISFVAFLHENLFFAAQVFFELIFGPLRYFDLNSSPLIQKVGHP
jgi:hypothetical protein